MNVACGNCLWFKELYKGHGKCEKTKTWELNYNHCKEWTKKEAIK